MQPTTRYARSGTVHIACQVIGSAPLDLVLDIRGVLPVTRLPTRVLHSVRAR